MIELILKAVVQYYEFLITLLKNSDIEVYSENFIEGSL